MLLTRFITLSSFQGMLIDVIVIISTLTTVSSAFQVTFHIYIYIFIYYVLFPKVLTKFEIFIVGSIY